MQNYLVINTVRNSYGIGFYIRAELNGVNFPELGFYSYNKKDAIKKYRQQFHLVGKHLTKIEY